MRNRHRSQFKTMKFGPGVGLGMGSKLAKAFAPIAGLALAAALSGCDANMSINGEKGKPLADLDLEGATPRGVVLASSDTVEISDGDALAIVVEGSDAAIERMRFTLDEDTLGILRKDGDGSSGDIATVRVTMPTPRELTLAGSGTIRAASLAGDSEVTVAGSGTVDTPNVAAGRLEVTIAGSGDYIAAGSADRLELTVAGSGAAEMAGLKAARAEVTVAGSGDASFASDGDVEASILGSGTVTVKGSARCTVNSLGSGKLVCSRVEESAE